jgi:hypothetical protein
MIHPMTPPIPAEHPSATERQRTVSQTSNQSLVHNIPDQQSAYSILGRKTEDLLELKRNSFETRVLDARSRAKLDFETTAAPSGTSLSNNDYSLTNPLLNSTKIIKDQLHKVQRTEFNSKEAIAHFLLQEQSNSIHNIVTTKVFISIIIFKGPECEIRIYTIPRFNFSPFRVCQRGISIS